eukprot:1996187-Pleurochrysis_carterae.AAC.1
MQTGRRWSSAITTSAGRPTRISTTSRSPSPESARAKSHMHARARARGRALVARVCARALTRPCAHSLAGAYTRSC